MNAYHDWGEDMSQLNRKSSKVFCFSEGLGAAESAAVLAAASSEWCKPAKLSGFVVIHQHLHIC